MSLPSFLRSFLDENSQLSILTVISKFYIVFHPPPLPHSASTLAKTIMAVRYMLVSFQFVLLSHDKIHLIWNTTFRLLTASLLQAMGSTGCGTALCIMVVCCNWCISIRLLFPCTMISSGVRWFFVRRWFRCFLIVGIHVHASGISVPLSLFILFGLSLM